MHTTRPSWPWCTVPQQTHRRPSPTTLVCLEADKFPPETLQFYHLQRQRAELGRLFAIRIHFGLADEQIRDVSVDVRGEHKRSTGFLLMLHKSRGVAVTG